VRKIERVAAWSLLPLLLAQFLSGYAILHSRLLSGILSKPNAFRLHRTIQPLTVLAFVLHGFPWIRRALARRGIRHRLIDGVLFAIGSGLIAFAFYLYSLG
jgi:hypothetical protein